ncbi:MAG TPA: hypothetical protein VFW87_02090 [Pirellulales bacterium]|nr:hypothetical protein [Pirellulales bacterium]
MPSSTDQQFLAAFMETARHFVSLAPVASRDPEIFELVARRAAEILDAPPIDLHHHVMEHMDELREERGGIYRENNSELIEALADYPQARRVFFAVMAACRELGPEIDRRLGGEAE